jgi:ABC-type uncharacterized transport system ATPase subunit
LPSFFHIFRIYFLNYLFKNPQTTIALTFLTHNISDIARWCAELFIQQS